MILQTDPYSGHLIILDSSEAEIHHGHGFFARAVTDVSGALSTLIFMFRTPANGHRIHGKTSITASEDFTAEFWEDITVSADGAEVTPVNMDRNASHVGMLEVFVNPTVTDNGTKIWEARTGTGKNQISVSPSINYKVILKADTMYMMKFTKINTGTHWIDADFYWYEEEPMNL